ncbi:sensor histidine kinase [Domibacillus enclensis]|uniref:histidine kinase n=1 Tax=Domibacillus enclensis TaxID=1017273 RepID=A0A1N6ZE63_9BACI|nr:sensor histidine kinase [Domibacillus enclensis]OXS76678.1 hypothetical protein B1B05_13510 [Domibacillus enclensis]SIR25089.1 Two-component sensor histidine kinase, contains HisKA and HATPase domains [Domibacillus enclensis]
MNASLKTEKLCRQVTLLNEHEIQLIVQKATMLQTIADIAQGNVYIDCMQESGESMIVVAEAVPSTIRSLYKDELLGKQIFESFEPAVFRTFRSGRPSVVNRGVTPHEGMHVNQNVTPILNEEGQPIGVLILEQDITSQVKREQELALLSEATEEINRMLWGVMMKDQIIPDFIEEGLILLDEKGGILYANNTAISLMDVYSDITREPYLHQSILRVLPFVQEADFRHTSFSQREITHENSVYSLKGIHLHPQEKRTGRTLIYLHDVTDLREKERQLIVKSTVIQEIHHRVKNNLQTVASLLRMQLRRGVPEEAKGLYAESLSRIMSIATVHEVLSHTGIERVNMKDIMSRLTKIHLYERADHACDVSIQCDAEDVFLGSHQGVSLALILTELIQNSLKHAFMGRERGSIFIKLKEEEGMIHLRTSDDGVGVQQEHSTDQLGMDIVKNLTRFDLNGRFEMESENGKGTVTNIFFPREVETDEQNENHGRR